MLFWMKVVIVLKSALARSCINSALLRAFWIYLSMQRDVAPTRWNFYTRVTSEPPQKVCRWYSCRASYVLIVTPDCESWALSPDLGVDTVAFECLDCATTDYYCYYFSSIASS